MAFRLPTHLESFIPPPSQQVLQSRPWRGTFVLSGAHFSNSSPSEELRITAAETDGDNRMDLWPSHLYVHLMHDAIALKDVQAWVKHRAPPLCTFMPDRLNDVNGNAINQANFRQLSRLLYEKQMVAIAPWRVPERLPGAGIIIYPTQTSSGMLVGAIFLTAGFPDFVAAALQPPTGTGSRILYGATGSPESSLSSSSHHPQYQGYPAHYAQPHTSPSPSSGNEGTSAYNSVHGSGQGQR